MGSWLPCAVVLLSLWTQVDSARVLMLQPVGGKSMKNMFYGMGNALSERGHEVIFFNGFKPSKPVKGIKEIVPDELAALFSENNFPNLFEMQKTGIQAGFSAFLNLFVEGPRIVMESKEFDQLFKEHFDIVILGPFGFPFFSLPYLRQIPFVMLTPMAYIPKPLSVLGNPTLPALSPNPLTSYTDQMSFMQRVQNALGYIFLDNIMTSWQRWYADRLVTKKFGAGVVPPNAEIERNMSLVFQSSNPVVDYHHPLLPNVIEIGGLHCAAPKPLPKHLRDFLGDSEFAYFSLGSVAKPEDMPKEMKAIVLEALGSLPYKVLLKWDTIDRTGIPPNVLPSRWLPQQDILGSQNCRLFITHGGFASVLESICHGVPMVSIPLSSDQNFNTANAVRLGVAVHLSWDELSPGALLRASEAALLPRVLAAVRDRSQLLQRQPVPPRQLAVHWVEHVIRHRGAPHLRSVGADLYWFQYYSLDVLAFLLLVSLLLLKLTLLLLSCCWRCLCGRTQSAPHAPHLKRD